MSPHPPSQSQVLEDIDENRISNCLTLFGVELSGALVENADSLMSSSAVLSKPAPGKGPSRRKVDFLRIAAELVCGLLRFISNDDAARVALLAADIQLQLVWRKFFQVDDNAVGAALARRRAAHNQCVADRVTQAWRFAKRLGDYQLARQMLSLLPTGRGKGGLHHAELAAEVSERNQIEPGASCRVLVGARNNWRNAMCVGSFGASISLAPPLGPKEKRGRLAITAPMDEVALVNVRLADDPHCTLGAIRAAVHHSLAMFPGAPAPRIVNDLPRTVGMSAATMASFLRRASTVARADGGFNTAKSGAKYLLKDQPSKLLAALDEEYDRLGLGKSNHRLFYSIIGKKWVQFVFGIAKFYVRNS